jgi:hypothetical protein
MFAPDSYGMFQVKSFLISSNSIIIQANIIQGVFQAMTRKNIPLLLLISVGLLFCRNPQAAVHFYEDFNSGKLDPARWIGGENNDSTSLCRVIDIDPFRPRTDYAFQVGDSHQQNRPSPVYLRSVRGFPRGNNLRVEFTTWGDRTHFISHGNPSYIYPVFSGLSGPWHSTNNSRVHIGDDLVGGIMGSWTGSIPTDSGPAVSMSWWEGYRKPMSGTILGRSMNDLSWSPPAKLSYWWNALAWSMPKNYHRLSKENHAIRWRIWLGNQSGMFVEFKSFKADDPKRNQWQPMTDWKTEQPIDTRVPGAGKPGQGDDSRFVYLGFASDVGIVCIDDLVVMNDSGSPLATPEPTPEPTPMPELVEDLRSYSSFFETDSTKPWQFLPAGKGHVISTSEFPGLLTIRNMDSKDEIKGILPHILPLAALPPRWEFETDVVHSFWTKTVGKECNAAIGLNVALTFSNPLAWPEDRNQMPPDTHVFRLYIVHLGTRWAHVNVPERFYVWGDGGSRGNQGFNGDWKIPTYNVGDGQHDGGPANTHAYLLFRQNSPTRVTFGVRFDQSHAYIMRSLDFTPLGPITGIWQIGPVVAGSDWVTSQFPGVKPVLDETEYHVGFCAFRYMSPFPSLQYMSNEFNHPGYIGAYQSEYHGHDAETWSHPGYLTATLDGVNNYAGGSSSYGAPLDFVNFPPPWEIETGFIPPDDSAPWDYHMNFAVKDVSGLTRNHWMAGIQNTPGKGRWAGPVGVGWNPAGPGRVLDYHRNAHYGPTFPGGVPDEILNARQLYLLIRVLDTRHLQMGVKAAEEAPWFMSPVWESPFEIGSLGEHAFSYYAGLGSPAYKQILMDYWRYRSIDPKTLGP